MNEMQILKLNSDLNLVWNGILPGPFPASQFITLKAEGLEKRHTFNVFIHEPQELVLLPDDIWTTEERVFHFNGDYDVEWDGILYWWYEGPRPELDEDLYIKTTEKDAKALKKPELFQQWMVHVPSEYEVKMTFD